MPTFYVRNISELTKVANLLHQKFMSAMFLIQIYQFWLNWWDIQFSLRFLEILRKSLSSSNITIMQIFIVPRYTETGSIYIVYPPTTIHGSYVRPSAAPEEDVAASPLVQLYLGTPWVQVTISILGWILRYISRLFLRQNLKTENKWNI